MSEDCAELAPPLIWSSWKAWPGGRRANELTPPLFRVSTQESGPLHIVGAVGKPAPSTRGYEHGRTGPAPHLSWMREMPSSPTPLPPVTGGRPDPGVMSRVELFLLFTNSAILVALKRVGPVTSTLPGKQSRADSVAGVHVSQPQVVRMGELPPPLVCHSMTWQQRDVPNSPLT